MGDGDDHDLFVAPRIDSGERKAAKDRFSESPTHRGADSRIFSDCLNCALDVIEKRLP